MNPFIRMFLRLQAILLESSPKIQDIAVRHKSRLLGMFLLLLILAFAGVDIVFLATTPGYTPPWYGYIFLAGSYLLNRNGKYHLAASLTVAMFPIVVFANIVSGEANDPLVLLYYIIPGLILAGILLSIRATVFFAVVGIAVILFMPGVEPRFFSGFESIVGPFSAMTISAILILVSMRHRDDLEADRQVLLRQSEERYRMLFEEAPDGILIVSRENRILMANTAIYQMMGYSAHEVLGRSPVDFVAPEDVALRPVRPVEAFQVPGSMRHERVLVCKNGSRLNVIISSSYMPDGRFQYIVQDITERKRMEDALRLSETKFARSFKSSPDAITISPIDTGKFIEVNDGFCRMSGYTHDEAVGRSAEELGIWDNVNDRQKMITILQREGKVRDFETILKRRSGELLNCLLSVEVIDLAGQPCMLVITRDVTERKRMEEELQLREERYRLVSSVISDYAFSNVINERGQVVLNWASGAFEQISGYTFEEFNARGGWVSTLHPEDVKKDARDMELLRNNQRVVTELRTIHKDGSVRWVRSYSHPIWDAEKNQLAGIYGAVQDITNQKQIEQEREKLIEELEAKNAELEQFTYTVSHDLKAPIITIKGFLGYLKEDAVSGNMVRLQTDIRRIAEATDRMHRLLNELLELSRVGRVMNESEIIPFEVLVNDALSLVQGRIQERGIRVTVHDNLPLVYGDRQRLLEVTQNLLDNAVKFMGDTPEPHIEVGVNGYENFMPILYVRDNGIGIAPQYHERIFGLFNRLDPKVDGTGVGLALVKRIVEFHGGRIWLRGEAGQGTTFFFTLPQTEKP